MYPRKTHLFDTMIAYYGRFRKQPRMIESHSKMRTPSPFPLK